MGCCKEGFVRCGRGEVEVLERGEEGRDSVVRRVCRGTDDEESA